MPSAIGVAMVAPGLARLCVSPEYVAPVTSLIAWMAIGALILAFRANYVDHGFHFGNSTTRLTVMMAAMSATNLAGDLVLIPRFGAVGAVYATIIAGSVGMVLGILLARSFIKLPFPKAEIAKIFAATAIMGLFLWPLRDRTGILVLVIQVAGGAAVFGAAALAFDLMHVRKLAHSRLAAWRGAH
jgi:O-antigen/teichoic acid export membrane protein